MILSYILKIDAILNTEFRCSCLFLSGEC